MKQKKKVLPGPWQGYAAWLLQVCEVQKLYGEAAAFTFVKESRKLYVISKAEADFALSLAQTK